MSPALALRAGPLGPRSRLRGRPVARRLLMSARSRRFAPGRSGPARGCVGDPLRDARSCAEPAGTRSQGQFGRIASGHGYARVLPMLSRLDLRGYAGDFTAALSASALALPSEGDDASDPVAAVREIVADVRARGDAALRELTERFDGCEIDDLRVPTAEVRAALDAASPELRAALEYAAGEIVAYHEAQRTPTVDLERGGVHLREVAIPVERAGLYVPGGRAAYPSTVLMTAMPARVAGVGELALCVPPDRDGRVPAATLAAAALAGVDEVYRVGGAQAIAALAYGTETIRPVDVDRRARQRVRRARPSARSPAIVGIESYAGPSEIVVVADDTARPELVAADLLAQAEHGPGGAAVLVTWSEPLADAVDDAVDKLLADAPRRAEIEATLGATGRIVLVDGPDAALAVVERDRAGAPRAHDRRSRSARPARAQRRRGVLRPVGAGGRRRLRRGGEPRAPHGADGAVRERAARRHFLKHVHVVDARRGRAAAGRAVHPRAGRGRGPERARSLDRVARGTLMSTAAAAVAPRAARRPRRARRVPLAAARRRRAAQHEREPVPAAAGVRRPPGSTRSPGSRCNRYPDRGARRLRARPRRAPRADTGARVLRQRLERGAADRAPDVRGSRSARARVRTHLRAPQPHRPHHRHRGRHGGPRRRLQRLADRGRAADRRRAPGGRVPVQPEQPDGHGRTPRHGGGDPRCGDRPRAGTARRRRGLRRVRRLERARARRRRRAARRRAHVLEGVVARGAAARVRRDRAADRRAAREGRAAVPPVDGDAAGGAHRALVRRADARARRRAGRRAPPPRRRAGRASPA